MTIEPNFPFFPRCLECGGKMELTSRGGRTREIVKGVHLPIPDDFVIPTCQSCGEEVWAPEMSEALDARLSKQLGELIRSYVDEISDRFDVTQAQIGSACRVNHTYISHVTAGRKTPSGTLVELLRIFVDVEGAFAHAFPAVVKEVSCEENSLDPDRIGRLVQFHPRRIPITESVTEGKLVSQPAKWKEHPPAESYPVAANGV